MVFGDSPFPLCLLPLSNHREYAPSISRFVSLPKRVMAGIQKGTGGPDAQFTSVVRLRPLPRSPVLRGKAAQPPQFDRPQCMMRNGVLPIASIGAPR
jgi:hypothetical protein